MYEAKVTKAELWNAESNPSGQVGPHYLVHYKGWKQTWDEWVPEERLKKFNEENIKQQRQLIDAQRARDAAERAAQQKAEAEEAKKKGAVSMPAGGPVPVAVGRREEKRGQKRGRDGEGEDEYMKRPEIKITIPDQLKVQLVDDWEAVTKNMQLVKLPRDPCVDVILEEWNKFHQNEEPETRRQVDFFFSPRDQSDLPYFFLRLTAEVASGLRLYFNKALGNNLLYRFEREQYSTQMKNAAAANSNREVEVSSIYGAEHLLRLFVNLPELLAHTAMDAETVTVLKLHMSAFLSWMMLNKAILFAPAYDNTSSAYQNNNRG
ncbi:mortality factor 4-like protein 1, partial [Phenoliferia sp. Uapishka_3]